MSAKQIGSISAKVIELLELDVQENTPIFLGDSNIEHMILRHAADYEKYGAFIPDIIEKADYVGLNKKDNSIEYVKEYKMDDEFVKVAVRVSGGSRFYARSIYVLNKQRVFNFISKNTLKKT